MTPTLLLVLSLPLLCRNELPVVQPFGLEGTTPLSIISGKTTSISSEKNAPAPAERGEPRLTSIQQKGRPEQPVLLGEPIRLSAAPFTIQLSGLSRTSQADHVVAYLDHHRVGSDTAMASTWGLGCEGAVIPKEGCLLRVVIFRDGAVPIALPPVVVHYAPPF